MNSLKDNEQKREFSEYRWLAGSVADTLEESGAYFFIDSD